MPGLAFSDFQYTIMFTILQIKNPTLSQRRFSVHAYIPKRDLVGLGLGLATKAKLRSRYWRLREGLCFDRDSGPKLREHYL